MALFYSSCWFLLTGFLFSVIRLVTRYFFRYRIENGSQKDDSSCTLLPKKDDEIVSPSNVSRCFDSTPEVIEFKDSEYDGFEEKETTPSFSFKFQFQSSEDIRRSIEEFEVANDQENTPKTMTSSHIREAYVAADDNSSGRMELYDKKYEGRVVLIKDFQQLNSEAEVPHEVLKTGCTEAEMLSTDNVAAAETFVNSEINTSDKKDLLSEKDYCGFDSDAESISLSDVLSLKNQTVDSNSDGCPFDTDFYEFQDVTTNCIGGREELTEGIQKIPETQLKFSSNSDAESIGFSDRFTYVGNQVDVYKLYLSDTESMDFSEGSSVMNQSSVHDSTFSNDFLSGNDFSEHKGDLEDIRREDGRSMAAESLESEDTHFSISDNSDRESYKAGRTDDSTLSNKFLSEMDFCENGRELEGFNTKEAELDDDSKEPSTNNSQNNPSTSDSNDMNGLESLWEHQDLIEQLRMELRKVRAIGLPTIPEESESPRTINDLKSWRIDEDFLHEDAMDELQKFSKSYRERMRKFDILNYQKMYAVGFLQHKDPLQLMGCRKSSVPMMITSLLSQNFRLNGRQKADTDPSKKFIKELQSDLETVYVGQACLSWEFLHWQYEKSRELSESNPQGGCQYNQVAGEFQQFQVLVQRFLENEPFQGPRVQNFVKSRCVNRNFLQVPASKEDCFMDKEEERSRASDGISSKMLTEIMEKSIGIFWNFIKADKSETNGILKGILQTETELQDQKDLELLIDIRADLQKKEKKLKDLLRTGHCLVKRFQKHQEEKSDQLTFFAQVDMKLVSRVLKMTRITTDQLVWCRKKLNKITFQDRRIHREPSFYLFPC
ncbi:hypothetical protein MRB53_034361 [Persea americana]|uniref:Uncharacterized protein n=1 Tax=Persea americana TaxID=3435 RepID=A0ACC2KXB9_PERAE|nr:hypothetical protein MRB53_034361 [Persea americana]